LSPNKSVSYILAVVAALAFFATACNKESAKQTNQQSRPFRIALNTWVGYSPLILAKEKGFLKEQGLNVEISILEAVGAKNSALIEGTVDGVGHTADAAVVSAVSSVVGQIVFVFDQSWGADGVLTKKDVQSVKDLRGKRVALEPGFTGHFFFLSLLHDMGLRPSDVQIVPMEADKAGSAFVAGKVEVAVTSEPWLGKARSMRDAKVLVSSADKPGRIIDVLFMNRQVIQERRSDVVKLVRALGSATDWYLKNTAEGDGIMANFWKLSKPEQEDAVAGIRFMTLQANKEFFGTSDVTGQLYKTTKDAAELWLEAQVIRFPVDPKLMIAYDVVNDAANQR
jgi:NitT/TauT family transport system substrate-binding protein